MNTMKTERKGKPPYTEKINTHVPSEWCVHSTFAYKDVPDPLKMNRGKDCVEKFVEYIEEEVKRLYETFPRQPMKKLTDEHEATERVTFASKSLMIQGIESLGITPTTLVYIEEQPTRIAT